MFFIKIKERERDTYIYIERERDLFSGKNCNFGVNFTDTGGGASEYPHVRLVGLFFMNQLQSQSSILNVAWFVQFGQKLS